MAYYGRFLLLIWAELPLYFIRKGKSNLAFRAFVAEVSSYVFFYAMTRLNPRASTFVFLLPFAVLRLALMVGNWGQHALVDEVDPNSDFRTSITMIDVMVSRTPLARKPASLSLTLNRATVSASMTAIIPHTISILVAIGEIILFTLSNQKRLTAPAEHLYSTISIGL